MTQPVPFERAPSIFCRELTNKYEAKKKDGDTRKRANQRALDGIQVYTPTTTGLCVDPARVCRRATHVCMRVGGSVYGVV